MTKKVPVMDQQLGAIPVGPGSPPPAARADRVLRDARSLIGWLPDETALRILNSNDASRTPTNEQRARVGAARAAVAARSAGLDQTDVVRDATGVPVEYLSRLQGSSAAAPYFAEGWEVGLADLARIAVFQPNVYTDSAAARVEGVDPADLGQLAAVTLPTEQTHELNVQMDEARNQFMLVSRNPNLRIVGHVLGPVQENTPPAFGFLATIPASFLQVARYGNRYFLRDGHHRALGLLSIGVRWAPVFVREIDAIQQLVPQGPGMLPQEAFTGDRPPVLGDFANDAVSASVQLPAVQKMILVQATELNLNG